MTLVFEELGEAAKCLFGFSENFLCEIFASGKKVLKFNLEKEHELVSNLMKFTKNNFNYFFFHEVCIALWIICTLPVTAAEAERRYSKLASSKT